MATTTAGSRNYVDFDEYIDFQLQKTRSNIKSTDILTAVAGIAAMFLAYLLVFVVFDHWIVNDGFGPVARWLMLGGLLIACAGWVAWKVIVPYTKTVTQLYAARTIESTAPGLKNTLLNLVDLRNAGREIPEAIRTAMEKRAAVTLSKADVDAVVDRRPLMRWSYMLLALVVLCCLYSLFSPKKISASVWRALFPASATSVDTAIKIDRVSAEIGDRLHDPDITVAIRSKLNIVVDLSFTGEPPESVMLYYSTEDRKFADVPVSLNPDPNEPKRYRAQLNGENGRGIRQTTSYRVEAGDAKAGPFTVTVVRPPVATVRSVNYLYPKYMEREPRTQDGGHIETWEGTTVTLTAEVDQPVREAKLVFTDTENTAKPVGERNMTITDGTKLSITLQKDIAFREDGTYPHYYHLQCIGKNGFQDPEPALYGITLRRDLPPTIELVEPQGTERDIPANRESLPLLYKAKDPDFKLRFVTLHAELSRAATPDDKPRELSESLFDGPAKKSIIGKFDWNLRPFQLKAGDSIRFRLQARDNKEPVGNRAYSRWVTLRIVEPVTQNEQQQQQQQDQQRRDQLEQQEQRKNQEDQQQGDQPQNGNPGGMKDPQKLDQQKPEGGPKKPNGKPDQGMPDGGGNKTQSKQQPENNGAGNPQQSPDAGTGEKPMPSQNGMGQNQPDTNKTQPKSQNKQPQNQNDKNEKPKKPEDAQDLLDKIDREQKQQQKQDDKPNPQAGGQKQPQPKENQPKTSTNPEGTQPDGMPPKAGTDSGNKVNPGTGEKTDPKQTGTDTGKTPPKDGMPGTEPKKKGPAGGKKKTGTPPKKRTPGGEKTAGGQNPGGMKEPGTGAKQQPDKAGMKTEGGGEKPAPPKTGDGKPKQQTTDPANNGGKKENVPDNGEPANKVKADGTETGKAQPSKNPTGDPTQAKEPGKIQRTEGADPAVKPKTGKTETGNPMQREPSKKPTGMEKTGPGNPMGDPNKTIPDQPKVNSKDPAGANDSGKTGTSTAPGKTLPKDASKQLPKTGGGMTGGKPDGPPGMEKQPPKAGKVPGKGMETGKPGQEPKKGSTTQQGGKGGKSGMGDPMPGGKPGQSGTGRGQQPGGGPGKPKKGNPKESPSGVPGDGTGPFDPSKPLPQLPPPASTSEKDLQNYGKNASNMQLNRLEDELNRGTTDPKKLGFDNLKDALEFVRKSKARVNNAEKNGDTQMLEYLKTKAFREFQQQAGKRTGDNVRKKALSGVGRTSTSEAPPHLKDYANAFKNSVGGGR